MEKPIQIGPNISPQDQNQIKSQSFALWQSLSELLTFFAFPQEPNVNEHTAAYLRFGAAKRISLILENVRWLTTNIPVDRIETLTNEECHAAGLHLNSVYLHIRGTLDNFAWFILWQLAPTEAQQLDTKKSYNQIGLFRNSVLKYLPATNILKAVIESLQDWNKDLSLRRDPVAHRLPLRVIPQVIIGEENIRSYKDAQAQLFQNIEDFAQRCAQDSSEDRDDSIHEIIERCDEIEKYAKEHQAKQNVLCQQMESLGSFVPVFTYSPTDNDLIPLYPTLTHDCSNLIKIGITVRAFIESLRQASNAPQ